MKNRILLMSLVVAIVAIAGCSGTIIPGLRLSPREEQKQAADAADALAGRLAITGARPGSKAAKTLARMTRPSAVYVGAPANPLDMTEVAEIEAGQWRHKDDQVKAAQLRDDLRTRAMKIVNERLASLSQTIADKKAKLSAVLDRFAAVAQISTMADDLAVAIPDPRPPEVSAETQAVADIMTKAAEKIAAAADKAATARPTAGDVVDRTLDAAENTAGKVAETVDRVSNIWQTYAPEIISALGVFGLGAGGYAVKKRRDAGKAKTEAEGAKGEAKAAQAAAAVQAEVAAALAKLKADSDKPA